MKYPPLEQKECSLSMQKGSKSTFDICYTVQSSV